MYSYVYVNILNLNATKLLPYQSQQVIPVLWNVYCIYSYKCPMVNYSFLATV